MTSVEMKLRLPLPAAERCHHFRNYLLQVVQGDRDVEDGEEGVEGQESDPVFAALLQDFQKARIRVQVQERLHLPAAVGWTPAASLFQTLAQMQRRPGMMTYSTELKRVLDVLVESHEQKQRYENACKELTARVAADTERTQQLAQQALQDQLAVQQQKQVRQHERLLSPSAASTLRPRPLQMRRFIVY